MTIKSDRWKQGWRFENGKTGSISWLYNQYLFFTLFCSQDITNNLSSISWHHYLISCFGGLCHQSVGLKTLRIVSRYSIRIRARWNWFKKIKLLKIKTGHMYSYVKLNFKASLFSCIFWFEAIFRCKTALLVFWPYSWENGTKRAQKMEFSKIGSKSTQKW